VVHQPFATARRDPHLAFAHGGHADFKGEDGAVYCFVSAANMSFNARFVYGDFTLPRKLVHGSYIGAVYWTIRTWCPTCENWGAKRRPRILNIQFNASATQPNPASVHEVGKPGMHLVHDGAGTWKADNVAVSMHGHGRTVVVSDGRWKVSVTSKEFPNAVANPGKYLLHVKVETLYDADHDVVAPHGLIGQSYDGDGVGVDGAQDDYRSAGAEFSTSAQAEGAIEGAAGDYKLGSSFATNFKFSRFDAVKAAPRNLSTLVGRKFAVPAGTANTASGAGDSPAMLANAAESPAAEAVTHAMNRIHEVA